MWKLLPRMLSWRVLAALTAVWEVCKVARQLQCVGAGGDSNAAARAVLQASCPMFEAFWQGRLIPGARIDSLPFVEVRRSCTGDRQDCISRRNLPLCTSKMVAVKMWTTQMGAVKCAQAK